MEFEYYSTQEEDDRLIKKSFEEEKKHKQGQSHRDNSPSYLKEAAGPGEGNLSGECLF